MDEKVLKSKLKELVKNAKGKKSVLEEEDVKAFFADQEISEDELEKCYRYLERQGIDILIIDDLNDVDEDKILISTEDNEEIERIEEAEISVPDGISTEDPVRM